MKKAVYQKILKEGERMNIEAGKNKILEIMSAPKYNQMPKTALIEWVTATTNNTQADAKRCFAELKKANKVYTVVGLNGWVGMHK